MGRIVVGVDGSVSHKCVTHAPCPVVVIPFPATDEQADEQGD